MKKLIYLAGPYSATSRAKVLGNIQRAVEVASELRRVGYVVFVPHLESMFGEDALNEDEWVQHGIRLLEACEEVMVLPGWERSRGTKKEIEYAKRIGLPIKYWKGIEE
jgi:hypothetical protein